MVNEVLGFCLSAESNAYSRLKAEAVYMRLEQTYDLWELEKRGDLGKTGSQTTHMCEGSHWA